MSDFPDRGTKPCGGGRKSGMQCATVTFSPARILTDAEQARMEDIVSAGFLRAMGLSS